VPFTYIPTPEQEIESLIQDFGHLPGAPSYPEVLAEYFLDGLANPDTRNKFLGVFLYIGRTFRGPHRFSYFAYINISDDGETFEYSGVEIVKSGRHSKPAGIQSLESFYFLGHNLTPPPSPKLLKRRAEGNLGKCFKKRPCLEPPL
jgi:hypothetical protein